MLPTFCTHSRAAIRRSLVSPSLLRNPNQTDVLITRRRVLLHFFFSHHRSYRLCYSPCLRLFFSSCFKRAHNITTVNPHPPVTLDCSTLKSLRRMLFLTKKIDTGGMIDSTGRTGGTHLASTIVYLSPLPSIKTSCGDFMQHAAGGTSA